MDKLLSPYRGDGPYVFVCYSHNDADSVYPELAWLQDYGVNVWYDEGISPGSEWTEELANAIQGCTQVLFFVTPNSVASEHCRRELNFAQEEGRDVLAVHLQPTQVPAGLRLSLNNRQAILKQDLADEEYRKRLIRATHAGPTPTAQRASESTTSTFRSGRGWLAAAVALAIVVGAVWWQNAADETASDADAVVVTEPTEPASPELLHNSVAVLPFDNLSLDPENAYFAAGIHEEVLNQLAKIKDLSVIARTTMLRYADSDRTIPEIGTELKVKTVMEGSVRYAGERVRITAQLIDTDSGAHLWSEAYEENLQDIFGIQLAIASRIAQTLEAEFSTSEQNRIASPATDNPTAYAHYLRAVSSWGNYAPTGPMHEAIDTAIALDPQFATGLAFKAFLHTIEAIAGPAFVGPDFDLDDQQGLTSLAQDYALRALAIDETQARAHWALGWVTLLNREWQASQRSFARAYELNPNDYIVLNGAAWASLHRGDVDTGVQRMQRSVALNPGDLANQGNFLEFLVLCERWEDAKRQADVLITLLPGNPGPYITLAVAASHLGDAENMHANAAIAEARLGTQPSIMLANAYRRMGDEANAQRMFDALNALGETKALNSLSKFWMHVAIKDYEVALDHLELAVDQNLLWGAARDLHFLSHHPMYDPVRDHPRFLALRQRVALPLKQDDEI